MAYASRLYPRAKPRGFTLQWIKKLQYEIKNIILQFLSKRLNKNQPYMTQYTPY